MSSHEDPRIKNAYTQAYSHRGFNRPKNTLRAYARGQELWEVSTVQYAHDCQIFKSSGPCYYTSL